MKILVGYDGSGPADDALTGISRAGLPDGSELIVASICETWLPPVSSLELVEGVTAADEFEALARRAAARLTELNPTWKVTTEVSIGSPGPSIVDKADSWIPDLIVLGSHGRGGLARFFFGSVSQYVLHHARCAVRIGRENVKPATHDLRLLIGMDGSRDAEAAVSAVASRKWPAETKVRLVNGAWKLPLTTSEPLHTRITAAVATEITRVNIALHAATEILNRAGLEVSSVSREEEASQLLLREAKAWGADCIFVGSRGMGKLERLVIGSISSSVAARAECSVEVVRTVVQVLVSEGVGQNAKQ